MAALDGVRAVLFDWGGTLMVDDPDCELLMVDRPVVAAVPGAHAALARVRARGARVVVATGATGSDERQIRQALARVGLAAYVDDVFCFANTGVAKGPDFYRLILDRLGLDASEALMVGDSLADDVRAAADAGVRAIWVRGPDGAGLDEVV